MNKSDLLIRIQSLKMQFDVALEDFKRINEPKPNRWYTKEEFIAFMFAHPVILVREKVVGSIMISAYPYVEGGKWYINTPEASVARDIYLQYEYTTDGKSWKEFGVEEIS